MAVKLSSYYWFRNNYLVRSLEDKTCEREFFNGEISLKDKKTLNSIIEKLDELKDESYFQQGELLISDNIAILNVTELKDVTNDSKMAAEYLHDIHKIMEKYWVQVELYLQLGKCFDELGLKPNTDVAKAIKYANDKIRFDKYSSLNHMCWETIKG